MFFTFSGWRHRGNRNKCQHLPVFEHLPWLTQELTEAVDNNILPNFKLLLLHAELLQGTLSVCLHMYQHRQKAAGCQISQITHSLFYLVSTNPQFYVNVKKLTPNFTFFSLYLTEWIQDTSYFCVCKPAFHLKSPVLQKKKVPTESHCYPPELIWDRD